MINEEIFSAIPMRTWRWLNVNEVKVPAGITEDVKTEKILVESGESKRIVLDRREAGALEMQVHIADGGELNLIYSQLVSEEELATSRIKVYVGKGAKFHYTTVEAGSKHTAAELTVDMAGNDSVADVWGLYFGDGERKIDLNYIIRQGGKRTDANMQVRGALLGGAEKTFRGTLDFLEGSKGSVGREDEEVMVLSDHVHNRSVPIMLSHEDDVDGHHAVSIGKMDEDKLFYLMSRGLDLAEAQKLVVEANFQPVLDRIDDEGLKAEIDAYLQRRLSHG
ncbi:putative iron-regulated ABC transporter membrane component [Selenomonas ruminantium subsp. lactilytica TAM6421]|uniref:Putative iron-regulated ABC transporter membrane component n=1 Tax=Selenomonas ruminantium subsp. lactilytica (strain NBRC 103574 / TAM6421) TaxID=927704 RepID=I0GM23_SELRL|nr:SufD family Fe-S cluster assembly protein [Selenomonas ruminantium]BAL81810.1 putative iron-regulated ABC transporter membrane component [Selenomonas ruminantium subsp. lactilytica TAM6421]